MLKCVVTQILTHFKMITLSCKVSVLYWPSELSSHSTLIRLQSDLFKKQVIDTKFAIPTM